MKFKYRDRVKYVGGTRGDSCMNPLWGGRYGKIEGTIVGYSGKDKFLIDWDNGSYNSYEEKEIEKIVKSFGPHPYTGIFK